MRTPATGSRLGTVSGRRPNLLRSLVALRRPGGLPPAFPGGSLVRCGALALLVISERYARRLPGGLLVLVLALATAAARERLSAQAPAPAAFTYAKDVAPILQKHCQSCHSPDS